MFIKRIQGVTEYSLEADHTYVIKDEVDTVNLSIITKTIGTGNSDIVKSTNIPTGHALTLFKNGEEWKNVFVDCAFKKGTDIANKSKINITNAFMTGSEYNGNTKPKIFVLDYEVVEGGNAPQTNVANADFMQVSEDMEGLPFS
jgi:hypothetical protein